MTTVALLTTTFYAFHDLQRPVYYAYARALLPPEEATVAVEHTLGLLAGTWSTVVSKPSPAAEAWSHLSTIVAHRTRHTRTTAEDITLLYALGMPPATIATATGLTPPAVVAQLLATSSR
ncbi:hypothetical protein ACWIG4_27375 [Streptomyces sp. NPDC002248]